MNISLRKAVLVVAGWCALLALPAGASDVDSLFARFKQAAGFDYRYPREKVYLHLDNNAYFEGETLWFKAYVVRASTLRPTTLSRVLYVELLDGAGRVQQRKLLRVDTLGQAHGEFKLDLPVRAGFYEVRAYTREMTNWGEAACFSRVVPVFAKTTDAAELNVPRPVEADQHELAHPRPAASDNKNVTRLEFYPEGGHRVGGVAQRIAYRLTDGRGVPLTDSLRLCSADGRVVAAFESEHEGMGAFTLPATFTSGYVEVEGERFALPEPAAGAQYALTADMTADGGAALVCSGNDAADGRLLGLGVFCREQASYFDTLRVYAGERVEIDLAPSALRGGVSRIELFDETGRSVASRLVWKQAAERAVQVAVRQNSETYDPFTPIAMELDLTDDEGRPVQTTFSLAVRDDGGELVRSEAVGAAADLLLASEVRGYIHHPEFYFEGTTPAHRRALDLLLMVQGWTANRFETLCGRDSFVVAQPIEEKLTLNGWVYRDNNKRAPYPGLNLRIKMYNRDGASLEGEAVTDSEGRFAMTSNEDFLGDWIAQISTRNDNDKYKWSRVALDRWFNPPVRAFFWQELELESPVTLKELAEERGDDAGVETFQWNDTIPRVVSSDLGEAVVTHKNGYRGFTGNRYTYRGGEETGMRYADVFYNIEQEVERCKDAGGTPGYIYDFLAYLDPDASVRLGESDYLVSENEQIGKTVGLVEGSPTIYASQDDSTPESINDIPETLNDPYLTYKNRKVKVYLNNTDDFQIDISTMYADEVKSVAFIPGGAKGRHIDLDVSEFWNLFIYEEQDRYRFDTKKGVEKRRIVGYSQPGEFFSPSYNGLDLPADTDVRRTLYWNPCVRTNAEGRATAVFYSNCREGQQLRVSARGVTADGRFVDYER